MRFLCDEMLLRLGRWLRAAGYDVVIAETGEEDRRLFQRAKAENRCLITRDSKLAEYRGADSLVVVLQENCLEGSLRELSQTIPINWLLSPFSRCLVCNTPLVAATEEQYEQLSDAIKEQCNTAYFCPSCRQLFWEGSHVRRMRQTLKNFSKSRWEIAE